MWTISLPHWWEFVIRAVVVYSFLVLLLRLTGKRQIGQMAPFDFVLLLVLSNAVQNSMNGGDNSITGGMILASSLVACNFVLGYITYCSRTMEELIEGRPLILIHNGKIDHVSMRQAQMTIHELEPSIRAAGCIGPAQVRYAVLENSGKISVIPRHDHDHGDKTTTPPTEQPPAGASPHVT